MQHTKQTVQEGRNQPLWHPEIHNNSNSGGGRCTWNSALSALNKKGVFETCR